MSTNRGSAGTSNLLGKLTSNIAELRRCRQQGGCRLDCAHDRTDDHRLPWDTDAYGGWGGHEYHGTDPGTERPPVVFVHGNQRDACDWTGQAQFFAERAYSGDELWAITFGSGSPSHDEMADQLDAFVSRVRDHTGASSVALVAHSLGVTGARHWLHRQDRYDWVDTLVGLAGANHGSRLNSMAVRAGFTSGTYKMSHYLREDYHRRADHPLTDLNADETPGDVEYYTIRGTRDPLFWKCQESPALDGAENVAIAGGHDDVRTSLTAVEYMYEWCSGQNPYNFRTLLTPDAETERRAGPG